MARRLVEERNPREENWDEPDALWIPPRFLARMKSEGFVVRWIRFTEGDGREDRRLIQRLHRGWQFLKPEEVQEWDHPPTADFGRFPNLIAVGDVALARCPETEAYKDKRHAEVMADRQLQAVKHNLMAGNNKTMPISDDSKIKDRGRAVRFAD